MQHPVVVGPQTLSLEADAPALRLPVEAHRDELTLLLPESAAALPDLQWTRNGLPLPGQTASVLRLTELTLDDSDLFYATWTDAAGTVRRSQSALVVVYPGHTLSNQSVRGRVQPDRPLVAGFVVGRSLGPVRNKRYLIRVIAASLQKFGVTEPLGAPVISFTRRAKDCAALLQSDPSLVEACSAAVGAFALGAAATDFAAVADLPPGAYALTVSAPADSTGGEVLIEIYETRA